LDERVVVAAEDGALLIEIADAGPGFDVAALSAASDSPEHMGLIGMRVRVESLGGSLRIRSALGAGTLLHIRLPLSDGIEGR
jgi:signal transduction histidine kinase